MYRVGLYTLGCKVSLYETEAIAEKFEALGFERASFDEACDVYVINTCTVTAESDAKSRKYIRRALRKNPSAIVCVVGCYSQNSPDEVARIDGVSVILGTQDKLSAPDYALGILEGRVTAPVTSVASLNGAKFEKMSIRSAERTRAYVKIEDGCECKCTYCAISKARGPVRSKAEADIIAEVEALSRSGTKEIVLTGIETGSWGADLEDKPCLSELISKLDRRGSCERIRLGSMAPELVSEEFIKRISETKIMTPHIHLSVQSASDRVLRLMKRRYNSEMLYRCVESIYKYMPKARITADLMVGFPGESEEDFLATLDFVERAGLLDAHVFAYSKREGTPAKDFDGQVPEQLKHERSARLIEKVKEIREKQLASVVECGEPLYCILESFKGGELTSHSDSYIEVRCKGDEELCGEIVRIKPVSHENGVILGEIIDQVNK